MAALARLALASSLVHVGTLALELGSGAYSVSADRLVSKDRLVAHQTPEELGFGDSGVAEDAESYGKGQFSEEFCLDIGAKGFPIPTFKMMQAANWDAATYFSQLQGAGYAEDALQMTGPDAALLKKDCMKERSHGRLKHIFVGDSQMMSLRNAFNRLNKCPELWWSNTSAKDLDELIYSVKRNTNEKSKTKSKARFHSRTQQSPELLLPKGCTEEGMGSFIHWDGWDSHVLPVKELKQEMKASGVDTAEGDTVVVWVGSNFIPVRHRMSSLLTSINQLHEMKVKLIWDSPTFHDDVIMAATTTKDAGRDPRTKVPITFNAIGRRKMKGEIGSNEYRTEKELYAQGIEVPTTKRWQISNRYRGLQCDGIHTDMRARDPLFYDVPCPMGEQKYGQSTYCAWVEPFKREELGGLCPLANGLDDLVLQSGLYSMCAAHEQPFCYQYTEHIR